MRQILFTGEKGRMISVISVWDFISAGCFVNSAADGLLWKMGLQEEKLLQYFHKVDKKLNIIFYDNGAGEIRHYFFV